MLDYIRIGCAVPAVRVADTETNAREICRYIRLADEQGCDVAVFPELAVTGYTCADLFFQETLLTGAMEALAQILSCSQAYPDLTAAVGLPVRLGGQLYNCAAVFRGGVLLGLVPKTYLPNYGEFYERRWFSSAGDLPCSQLSLAQLGLPGEGSVSVGADLLFRVGDSLVGVEICEDLWSVQPPSTELALNGAEVIVNLSASNETPGKRQRRRELVRHQSSICRCVYAYCGAGFTESTQDLVFSGHSLVTQDGRMLGENKKLIQTDYLLVQDADLGMIRSRRLRDKTMHDAQKPRPVRTVGQAGGLRSDGTLFSVSRQPFVPEDPAKRRSRCEEIFAIQAAGLGQRLKLLGAKAVIGVSGGLDSALALLVAVQAMEDQGRSAAEVCGISMPCFGTTSRTHGNARRLMELLGVTQVEIPIAQAVEQHFRDIGHDANVQDSVYENAQARERMQVLMDYAGKIGGIVVGTGDLSELALGWCTYNGDHMSMYAVNGTVPKTLLRAMLPELGRTARFAHCLEVLEDIAATPISPELLPAHETGDIAQQTEKLVGPYVLHDFFLYHMIRFGFSPKKIHALACRVFAGEYAPEEIAKWLQVFYRRFFSQQFKRNCMPDGVKVGSVCLSPRGDWRMPSDATARLWLEEARSMTHGEML